MTLNIEALSQACIPEYFQRVDSMPEDPEGSVAFMFQADTAAGLAMIYPIDPLQAMPYASPQIIIDGILCPWPGIWSGSSRRTTSSPPKH